jgi:hypothetical protein
MLLTLCSVEDCYVKTPGVRDYDAQSENHRFIRCIVLLKLALVAPEFPAFA